MKKLRSLIPFLLALALCFSTAAFAQADGTAALPQVGDRIGGFVVQSVTPYDVLGATGVLFQHEKNGATLLYLASEDSNVSFDITFRTPALDEKGKPHVFEHMTICGSQKYPEANMFFPFSNQTYSTYVNACTYHGMTSYPVSSLSQDQLLTMMDYYLSGVFSPLLYTEPRLVSREAWRYELADVDAPLTIAGTVYSEMQGALTIGQLHGANVTEAMFKDGLTAHESGGRPEAIRTLTYDELIAFHDAYYHPSNCLITLYGKLDYEKFITAIDQDYISKFDRQDVQVERGQVEPYTETLYAAYDAPVEQGAQTADSTFLTYAFTSNDITMEDELNLEILASVLNNDSSPVMRLLDERLPGVSVSCSVNVDQPAPVLTFSGSAANEEDRNAFVQAIDEGLAQIAKDGLSQDDLDATLASSKLSLMLTSEDSTLGVNASLSTSLYWVYFGSVEYYNAYEKAVNTATTDSLTALLTKYVTDNPYRSVCVTKPVAGLAEENAAKLADELAQKKASLSDAEIQELVEQTKTFAEWSAAPADQAIVSQVANMTVDKLPETAPAVTVQDETADDVRYITATADASDVAQTMIALDASAIPAEKLKDAAVFVQLLGSIGTEKYTKEELPTLISRYLGVFMPDLSATRSYTDGQPTLYNFTALSLNLTENAEKGYELMEEILLHTDLSQTEDIKNDLTQSLYGIRLSMDDPLSLQFSRCMSVFDDVTAYNNYIGGISMYDHLKTLAALADSDPAQLTARLEEARDTLLVNRNATVLCVGSPDAVKAYTAAAASLLAKLPKGEAQSPADYSALRLNFTSEALVNNSTVHMNVIAAPAEGYTGKSAPVASLIADKYMLPHLRNAMGAYGAFCNFGIFYDCLYTYRDPNLTDSFDVFAALPEYLRTVELTQEDVDSYIIGSYGQLQYTGGKLTQALAVARDYWQGRTVEDRLQWMKEAKTTTPEDVRAAAEQVEKLISTGIRSTSGQESVAEEHKDLFDSVVKLDAE